ncbi:LOW QUALITY PROTEIN: DDB1- and CUL4-associated factor 15 [Ara ararauna]
MAPSANAERGGGGGGGKRGPGGAAGGGGARGRREHLVRQLQRGRLYGQLSPRLFRKLPPRVCVSLKSIVDEELLRVGHIFLGFSKCGRFVLSYTSNSSDDDLSFYIYHLYWWQFNVHSKLKLVRQVRLFQDEEIYSDLYLTVCEWPSDAAKVIVFGFNTRSATGLLLNMMMLSDDNHRDIYISIVAAPAPLHCALCRTPAPGNRAQAPPFTPGARQCLCHGFMLHTKYQVVYPFPTFQPAFQLKRDHVVLLNTSYSLVACAVAVRAAGGAPPETPPLKAMPAPPRSSMGTAAPPYQRRPPPGPRRRGGERELGGGPPPPAPSPSPAVAKAKEFVADLFRRAKGTPGPGGDEDEDEDGASGTPEGPPPPSTTPPPPSAGAMPPAPTSPPGDGTPPRPPEPGYINYTQLRYVLEPGPAEEEPEDDKISLPFLVTDLRGRSLKPLKERAVAPEQFLAVEQLTLDFEYVINEVIRHDAAWARQFCSFSDYDIVILEVCPETNQVVINIGLLLLAFPSPDEEGQLRPKTYHTSLKVAWDLNTGAFVTVGVGDLTEVKGQTSGSVWSGYRKGCVDTVMRWLVPESSARYVNRMTNEALHKGCSLKVLADNERYTWIVL